MSVAGIDYSTRFVDVVLLDEDTDAAAWRRFPLHGNDAFDRTRSVRDAIYTRSWWTDSPVIAVGIEDPRGYNAGALYRIQGAILASFPDGLLVHPLIPSSWRKTVGLAGNASKLDIEDWVWMKRREHLGNVPIPDRWPQDACDAYCIALATRTLLDHKDAA